MVRNLNERVMDRTGHRSSAMLNRYRRVARTVAEARLGDLAPLDRAIPEVADAKESALASAAAEETPRRQGPSSRKQQRNGSIAQSVELRTFNP